jgi:hypothetical protein
MAGSEDLIRTEGAAARGAEHVWGRIAFGQRQAEGSGLDRES